ncbi:MAG TPA: glycosyltransferase family 2 protein [Thermoleophilia bacterium]|nr:glycosyltransferase family 2 protein [Thermoleophilia bacterium]
MRHAVVATLDVFDWFVLGYFLILNVGYLLLFSIAAVDFTRYFRRTAVSGHERIFSSPLTPGVSIIVPAFNEQRSIVQSVHSMLALRYPDLEVVVVDDGSNDDTFEVLRSEFGLQPSARAVPRKVPNIGPIRSVWVTPDEVLVVVRKENARRRSDACNAGINAARKPLVCMVDADSMLDSEALLRVVKPFVDDPRRVVGSGGVVRVGNGAQIDHRGRIVGLTMPRSWLARIQVVEYLRSFLLGRTGWSRINGLLIISGAFGVFRRDVVLEVGGLDLESVGEDCELVTRIHRVMRRERRAYRIAFVAEPVCWTEVPFRLGDLASQRTRWSRGLAQVLRKHRSMIGNPRYGRIGLLTMPYYLAFELFGAVIELVGVIAVLSGLALGVVNVPFAILFAFTALALGLVLSIGATAIEEFSFHRYQRWRDLGLMLAAAIVENVGYRQLHAWWRCCGLWQELRGGRAGWDTLHRGGFEHTSM